MIYEGKRTVCGVEVLADGKPLSPNASLTIKLISPTGFNWGYGGSGPAQLALAILLDLAGKEFALAHYWDFKWAFVAQWGDEWSISGEKINEWLREKERREDL